MPLNCIFQPSVNVVSETFIEAHRERLPGAHGPVYLAGGIPHVSGRPVLKQDLFAKTTRKLQRTLLGRSWKWEIEQAYINALIASKAEVALAEYGPTGIAIRSSCKQLSIPLVVHFHGYDASQESVLQHYVDEYVDLFEQASAVVAVSRAMQQKLRSIGCPDSKLIYSPYGIDCELFGGASPEESEKSLLAVGRFVDKKAPYLTLFAFSKVLERVPEARLKMIGDGPLLGACINLAHGMGISRSVEFMGAQPHDIVMNEMRKVRALVQHSVVAPDGDSEGTPLAILEAGATGVPVVATRHAGIPDVIIEGTTGFLVDELDASGMTRHMVQLLESASLAGDMGAAARAHVNKFYTMEKHIERLDRILDAAVREIRMEEVQAWIDASLPIQ